MFTADQQAVYQPENPTDSDDSDGEEDSERLVIDERSTEEAITEAVDDQEVPYNVVREPNQQRETVIQLCQSNGAIVGKDGELPVDAGTTESPSKSNQIAVVQLYRIDGVHVVPVPVKGELPKTPIPTGTCATGVESGRQSMRKSQSLKRRGIPYVPFNAARGSDDNVNHNGAAVPNQGESSKAWLLAGMPSTSSQNGSVIVGRNAPSIPESSKAFSIPVFTGVESLQQRLSNATLSAPVSNSEPADPYGAAVPGQGESSKAPISPFPGLLMPTLYRPRFLKSLPSIPEPPPLAYNRNMARQFPGAENRTPEQQAIRDKNTKAARLSRHKMRVRDQNLRQEAQQEADLGKLYLDRAAAELAYINELCAALQMKGENWPKKFEHAEPTYMPTPIPIRMKLTTEAQTNGHSRSDGHNDQRQQPNENEKDSETDSAPEGESAVLDLSLKGRRNNGS